MPRDLSKEATVDSMPRLNRENAPESLPPKITTSPEAQYDDDDMDEEGGGSILGRVADQRNEKRDGLHPYTQTLTLNDIESCVRLEEATFPPNERCSREKVSPSPACPRYHELSQGDKLVVRYRVCVVTERRRFTPVLQYLRTGT